MSNAKSVKAGVIIKKLSKKEYNYWNNQQSISDINNLNIETILALAEDLHLSEANTILQT